MATVCITLQKCKHKDFLEHQVLSYTVTSINLWIQDAWTLRWSSYQSNNKVYQSVKYPSKVLSIGCIYSSTNLQPSGSNWDFVHQYTSSGLWKHKVQPSAAVGKPKRKWALKMEITRKAAQQLRSKIPISTWTSTGTLQRRRRWRSGAMATWSLPQGSGGARRSGRSRPPSARDARARAPGPGPAPCWPPWWAPSWAPPPPPSPRPPLPRQAWAPSSSPLLSLAAPHDDSSACGCRQRGQLVVLNVSCEIGPWSKALIKREDGPIVKPERRVPAHPPHGLDSPRRDTHTYPPTCAHSAVFWSSVRKCVENLPDPSRRLRPHRRRGK